ncbi:MAG: hypothetical protein J2P37_14960 [Ktedonobacteraceae bacterium]|nr:hypothetical protein [Ktedonobacteraceae bacterium]MBO0796518.1 hypothetical protein [Ktedonobacteraceae bacterium]
MRLVLSGTGLLVFPALFMLLLSTGHILALLADIVVLLLFSNCLENCMQARERSRHHIEQIDKQ